MGLFAFGNVAMCRGFDQHKAVAQGGHGLPADEGGLFGGGYFFGGHSQMMCLKAKCGMTCW
jgi:hypothetical protein